MIESTLTSSSSISLNPQLWFKDAIIYEASVRAFADSNEDGIGDFQGLMNKLDYLQDLGITAIWLLPFTPSPLRDDGYDTADFTDVNPIYGTLHNFKAFLQAAHDRDIRVIIELILNHTSDQHAWFQRSRHAPPGSPERDFYVWSDTRERYREARIIFQDFESSNWTWDSVAQAYYWHRFYYHQPDLNYDNPAVQQAAIEVTDFWLDLGVDGLRLDAVPYLYEREGTNCENLPETHLFLKRLRQHVDEKYGGDRMLLAEANQWPEDAVAYFGEGDECHMDFHFPLMPRLFMAVQMEDRFPIIDILDQTPAIPETCQWAIFLRNHDELTLEMVTDEDRDYMYSRYAQDPQARVNLGIRRRLAPLLGNNRSLIELMNGLLFSLPGTPVIYYGDEIGMGDNIYLGDRNGVRTPMQWSADRNAGFSKANPQKLYLPVIIDSEYHYESLNVEFQQANPNSLWWKMKRLIAVRKRYQAFGWGDFEFLYPQNRKVLAYVRSLGEQRILVVANLARYMQCVELDLAMFEGLVPIDIFGRSELPVISSERPYLLTLASHTFYWLSLEPQTQEQSIYKERQLPALRVLNHWTHIFQPEFRPTLEQILTDYLYHCQWFTAKSKAIQSLELFDLISIPYEDREATIALIKVEFNEGDPQKYVLPLTFLSGDQGIPVRMDYPYTLVAQLTVQGQSEGILCDALADRHFLVALMQMILQGSRYTGRLGVLNTASTQLRSQLQMSLADSVLEPHGGHIEQANPQIHYGDQLSLEIFRKLVDGPHPELEIGCYLTEQVNWEHSAAVVGSIEYSQGLTASITLGILKTHIAHEGDAWHYTLDELDRYFEQIWTTHTEIEPVAIPKPTLLEQLALEVPELAYEMIGSYLESARLLGQRTAEFHQVLAAASSSVFAPEAFSTLYQRSIYQSMRTLAGQVLPLLNQAKPQLSASTQQLAEQVDQLRGEIDYRFLQIREQKISAFKIRCHGDYRLEQILFTGKDFVIDFVGEPTRTLIEQRSKRSPIQDIAGILLSFQYAVSLSQRRLGTSGMMHDDNQAMMMHWARFWRFWVDTVFMKHYFESAYQSTFLPHDPTELKILLDAYRLEKAIYELGYELTHRLDLVDIPLQSILQVLNGVHDLV